MIGRIAGVLLEKNPPYLLVDCGGVGYEIAVPMSTFYNLPNSGEKVVLLTQLIVREDAHLLYGFGTQQELAGLVGKWPANRLVEVWNGIPGLSPVKKFTDRKSALARLRAGFRSPPHAQTPQPLIFFGFFHPGPRGAVWPMN